MSSDLVKAKFVIPIVLSAAALWTTWKILQGLRRKKNFKFREMQDRVIYVVNTPEDWERLYPTLKDHCDNIKVVGFDCEWVLWGQRLPVALIQIATYDGLCVLVRIFQMTESIPLSLKKFLADKSILKVGVSCKDDAKKLFEDYGLTVSGCVDLRHILGRVRGYQCAHQGLQGLAKAILNVNMTKDKQIRCGDWEAEVMSEDQIRYAADDAIYAVDMFMQLVAVKCFGVERTQSYYGNGVNADEESIWKSARSICQGVVDVAFKSTKATAATKEDDESQERDQQLHSDISIKPGKHKDSYKAYMTRKRPLYYNCRLLAPDGKCLTQCDIRKANWYIDKGLGVQISQDDEPMAVQLRFEPSKRPTSDQDYYLQDKENICVVCGASDHYIRKLIVPQEYRKYFPPLLKDHSSHDVLLMCLSCHQRSSLYDTALRQRLAQECDAPMDSGAETKTKQDRDLQKIVSAAKALLTSKHKIPKKRVEELEDTIRNFYGVSTITEDLLRQAQEIDFRIFDANHIPHGKKVVMHFMREKGGLLEFEKMWRRQFIETMEPKYLPNLWSVDHKPERMEHISELTI